MKIVIDPGHGGKNEGAVVNKLIEKEITLKIAEELAASLPDHVTWVLTRGEDAFLSLSERGVISAATNVDLVVSIHVNAHTNTDLRRCDIFHWPGNERGKYCAEAIGEAMPTDLKPSRIWAADDRWERVRNVISRHEKTVVLVECGYATNQHDRLFLMSEWGRSMVVSAIRSGICKYGLLLEREKS